MEMLHTIPPLVGKSDPFILAMRSTDRWVAAAFKAEKDGDRAAARHAMVAWEAPSVLEAVLMPLTHSGTLTKVWRAIDLHDAFTLGLGVDSPSRRHLRAAYGALLREDRVQAAAELRLAVDALWDSDTPRCIRQHAEGALKALADAERARADGPTLEDLLS
jgi:hypothetical protein